MSTIMKRIIFFALCVPCTSGVPRATDAAPPARTMYTQALAREQTVRTALAAPSTTAAVLADVHAVVAAYEALVRRYPGSGYSDDALWQAGRLSLDAFTRFGQPPDRDAAVRLLKRLTAGYPSSKLVAQVPEQLAKVNAAGGHMGPPLQTATDATPHTSPNAAVDPRAGPSRIATIKDIRRAVLPDAVRITIELDGEVPFHEERIPDPDRVFVDLPGTRAAAPLVDQTLRFTSDADIVRQVRIGRHPNRTTRVVLDAAGVTSYSV